MADENKAEAKTTKDNTFAETVVTPAGEKPAYPQVVYAETGEKHPDGAQVMKQLGVAKNPDEHKKMLGANKSWGK